jgi:hypothetical protein
MYAFTSLEGDLVEGIEMTIPRSLGVLPGRDLDSRCVVAERSAIEGTRIGRIV